MRRSVADTTAVAACGYQHHCCWLPVDCCIFLAVAPSPCKCCSHRLLLLLSTLLLAAPRCLKASRCSCLLLFLLLSLLSPVDTLPCFCLAAAVALSCLCGSQCFLRPPFFCLSYHYSDGHAFSAVTYNHRWLIVTFIERLPL